MFEVETVKVGYLETNCYVLKKDHQCLIIDPGDDFQKIKQAVGHDRPLAVLLTHHHFDHIGALQDTLREYSVPVYDYDRLNDREKIAIGPFHFQILYTPGHDDTCITFYFIEEKTMFVGDFVFKESIGRMDLGTGSEEKMEKSLERLKQFQEDIVLYPGHGDKTTLNHEKQYNIYF